MLILRRHGGTACIVCNAWCQKWDFELEQGVIFLLFSWFIISSEVVVHTDVTCVSTITCNDKVGTVGLKDSTDIAES